METAIGVAIVLLVAGALFAFIRAMVNWTAKVFLYRQIKSSIERLTSGDTANFKVLDAAMHGYRLVGNEKLLAIHSKIRHMGWASAGDVTYTSVSASAAVPGVRGVRVRVGSGNVTRHQKWKPVGKGRLLVTSDALVFEGDTSNDRWRWNQIAKVEFCIDGYIVRRRKGKPVVFEWNKAEPDFCAIAQMMLHRVV